MISHAKRKNKKNKSLKYGLTGCMFIFINLLIKIIRIEFN